MAGFVHIPWYATGFRGDQLEVALTDVSAVALRYGATGWHLYRSRDDRYRLLQILDFESKDDFDRWWSGHEMVNFRVITSGWWQVPVLYVWHDIVASGAIDEGNGNGRAAEPAPERAPDAVA